jgi:hypothetical protein
VNGPILKGEGGEAISGLDHISFKTQTYESCSYHHSTEESKAKDRSSSTGLIFLKGNR